LQTDAPAPKAEEVETQETKAEETKPQQTQAPDTKVQETKATTLEPQDAKAQQTKPQEVKAQGIDAQEAKAQDNTPAPARGGAETGTQASVPPPAQAAPHASEAAPAGATKQDAAAPHQDAKQDGGSGAGKDAKQDAKQDGNAQSPAPAPSGAPANAQTSTPSSAQTGTQASAGACPGNPNALGTSRVLAIDPADFKRIGRMQYPDSLPLQDKEVVITFDDGPLPPYSTQILDILKSECVKVTYFLVGEMARAYPALVRREYEEGHTIGTHSEDHPLHFGELSLDRMRAEIDRGISDVGAALGDTKYLAPFFRLPGLDRSNLVEEQLAARNLIVFSSDTVADDWRHVSPEQIKTLALKRLEERGKGILLLHDIHAKTAAALPGLLKALKDNGFRIVQVVPSASYEMAMLKKPLITKPMARILASAVPAELKLGAGLDNAAARPAWPQPAAENLTADIAALPAPDASAFQPDSVADDSASVQWPEQPKASAAADDDKPRSGKTAERTRHKKHDSDSAEHEGRHHRDHDRKRAGNDRHRADLVTEIKSLAALLIPAH
jgi:peptidoglycan/xylan/chitin deacetylase (PgdA/CDA1 family)